MRGEKDDGWVCAVAILLDIRVGNPNKTDDAAIVLINAIRIPLQTAEVNVSENMEKLSN